MHPYIWGMIENKLTIMEATEFRSLLSTVVNEQLQEFKNIFLKLAEKKGDSDVYLTRKEAAAFLKISKTTLWNLDKIQVLPARRLNGKVLYLKSDLLNFTKE